MTFDRSLPAQLTDDPAADLSFLNKRLSTMGMPQGSEPIFSSEKCSSSIRLFQIGEGLSRSCKLSVENWTTSHKLVLRKLSIPGIHGQYENLGSLLEEMAGKTTT
jgi:hypothetical protein